MSDSHYDIFFLQNRVTDLNMELSELKGKIRQLISNIEDSHTDYHPWEITKLLEELLE